MNNIEKYKPPRRDSRDIAQAIVRAGVGAIPYGGAAATEILNLICTPSLEKRRDTWMYEVGNALLMLEEKLGIVLESLEHNNYFIDTAIETTTIAFKTSNGEKREFLKNAILNSALPNPPEEALRQVFLSLIDTLTVWHFRLLEFMSQELTYRDIPDDEHRFDVIKRSFPELREKKSFIEFIWNDLSSRGLVSTDRSDLYGSVLYGATDVGDLFLSFVRSPIEDV